MCRSFLTSMHARIYAAAINRRYLRLEQNPEYNPYLYYSPDAKIFIISKSYLFERLGKYAGKQYKLTRKHFWLKLQHDFIVASKCGLISCYTILKFLEEYSCDLPKKYSIEFQAQIQHFAKLFNNAIRKTTKYSFAKYDEWLQETASTFALNEKAIIVNLLGLHEGIINQRRLSEEIEPLLKDNEELIRSLEEFTRIISQIMKEKE